MSAYSQESMPLNFSLSSVQKPIWSDQVLHENSALYNIGGYVRIEGKLDTECFCEALNTVLHSAKALTVGFVVSDGMPFQQFILRSSYRPEYLDFSASTSPFQTSEKWMCTQLAIPIKLSDDWNLQFALLKVSEESYIWFIKIHHMLIDGWGISCLVKEVANAYTNLKEPNAEKSGYKDGFEEFLGEDEKYLSSTGYTVDEQFWLSKFSDLPAKVNIGRAYPPKALTEKSGRKELQITSTQYQQIQEKASEKGASTFHYLLAVLYATIAKTFSADDLVIGLPVLNRTNARFKKTVGLFAGVIPLRINQGKETSFDNVLKYIQTELRQCYKHQQYPMDALHKKLKQEHPALERLFDLTFSFEKHDYTTKFAQWETKSVALNNAFEAKPLAIFVREYASGEDIKIDFDYNLSYWNEYYISQFVDQYRQVLEQTLLLPECKISELQLLKEEEKHRLISAFDNTAISYPKEKNIVSLFKEQAIRFPEKTALKSEAQTLSYTELDRDSDLVARHLLDKGVKSNELVALLADRSPQTVVAVLGILKAGAAYVPIDPGYPAERVHFLLADSGAKVVVSGRSSFEKHKQSVGEVSCLQVEDVLEKESRSLKLPEISPSDPAYVIYTSGSTGIPKGTLIPHKNIVRLFFTEKPLFDFNENDVWSLFHSFSFDFSVWEMFGALLSGATLVMISRESAMDPGAFAALLSEHKITVLNQTPSAFNSLQEVMLSKGHKHSIRYVIFGGESLKPLSLKRWHSKFPETKLINMYGITETTVHVTYKEIGTFEINNNISNIGKPIPTLGLVVLDEAGNVVPPGVPGELCVYGEGLAYGYLRQPELTASRFVQLPILGEKLYRSGDLARYLPDGEIEYLGRMDFQVKIRGHRIELQEVESAIMGLSGTKEVLVIPFEEQEVLCLCAYVVMEDDTAVPDFRKLLGERLPAFMIPSYFVQIPKLPLTVNGKTDRKALPPPVKVRHAEVIQIAQFEKQISIFEEVLQIKGIGPDDNYFELGGDSIKAIKLISALNTNFSSALKVADIFRNPSPRMIAGIIESAGTEESLSEVKKELEDLAKGIKDKYERSIPSDVTDLYPLSDIQLGMLYFTLRHPDKAIYHDQLLVPFSDSVFNFEIFKEALSALVNKHEVMRTSVAMYEFGEPLQVIHEKADLNIQFIDVADLGKDKQEAKIEQYLEKDRAQPFVLNPGNFLWRMLVFKTAKDRFLLAFVFHHAIMDGWSHASFTAELIEVYHKLKEGKKFDAPKLKSNYKDYIAETIAQSRKQEVSDFWKEEIQKHNPLEFPVLQETENTEEKNLQRIYPFDASLVHKLKEKSRHRGNTLRSLCFAAYCRALKLFTWHDKFTIGLVEHNRPALPDGEKILGCFLNTVPFVVECVKDQSWDHFLHALDEKLISLKAFNRLSLPRIAALAGIVPEEERNVFFDTLFGFVDFHVMENAKATSITEDFKMGDGYAKTNTLLDVVVSNTFDQLALSIKFSSHYFDQERIDLFQSYFMNALRLLVEEGPEKISNARIMGKTFTDEENLTVPFSPDKTLIRLFEEQVSRDGEAIALEHHNEVLTYAELNENANCIAQGLKDNGIVRGDVVAVTTHRSFEVIAILLGILKAGAAYLPIDTSFPAERINFMLKDSNAKLLIRSQSLVEGSFDVPVLDSSSLKKQSSQSPDVESFADDVCYIIYTSGSTGQPKGVLTSHANVINIVRQTNYISIQPSDKILQHSNMAFDGSVFDIFGALLNGASLVLIDQKAASDTLKISQTILEHKVSVMFITTALFNALTDTYPSVLKHMRKLLFGGERVSVEHVKRAFKEAGPGKIIHVYGPTETTVFSNFYPVDSVDENAFNIPIGKPVSRAACYLMDAHSQSLSPEVTAELCIGGEGLAKGYLNAQELTDSKFVSNPFGKGKLYRTGDLVRKGKDGNITFIGRIDRQLKIRGFRIELGEIEAALRKANYIKECFVTDSGHAANNELLAFVTGDLQLDTALLKEELKKTLPGFMIPSRIIQVEKLPLSTNGKVDRIKLLANVVNEDHVAFAAPEGETENELAGIWSEILHVPLVQIGRNTHFFETGGHSLNATLLAAKIHRAFGVQVSLKVIFESPQLSSLSKYIESHTREGYISIPPAEKKEYYPLSSAQRRLFILHQMDPAKVGYNMPGALLLEGELDLGRLESCFTQIIQRHESLRTLFFLKDGEPYQQVLPAVPFSFERLENPDTFVRPFHLGIAPLLRVAIKSVGGHKHLLFFDMHHIISDGMSINILKKEITAFYNGESLGEVKLHYKDFSGWQAEQMGSPVAARQKDFWLDVFKEEVPVLALPVDFTRPRVQSFEGSREVFYLDPLQVKTLSAISTDTGSTLFMTLLAVYTVFLSKHSGQDDIVVGTPVSGRSHADTENIMGMFVNTLPLRNKPQAEKTFLQFLKEIKEHTLDALNNQDFPFEELIDHLNLKRELSRNPLFDVMFALQNVKEEKLSLGSARLTDQMLNNPSSKFDLTVECFPEGDRIRVEFEYCTKLFSSSTIKSWMKRFSRLVDEICSEPGKKIRNISVLSTEEESVLMSFSEPAGRSPEHDLTIMDLFLETVKRYPEKIAVTCEGKSLTYTGLYHKAKNLTLALKAKGVAEGSLVGVLVERDVEAIISIFGILMAGAVYVPIDTAYPADRINYILNDSNASAVITQSSYLDKFSLSLPSVDIDALETSEEDFIFQRVQPSSLAYVIYTSGSTGNPKGVMIEHKSLASYIGTFKSTFELSHKDAVLHQISLAFDTSVEVIFPILCSGGKLVIMKNNRNLSLLPGLLRDHKITVFSTTPLVIDYLNSQAPVSPHLKFLLSGGEVLKSSYIDKLYREVRIFNGYGPSEATVCTSFYEVKSLTETLPIGKPIADRQVYILDAFNKLVPLGVKGELCISGKCLSRGYLKRTDLSSEKFIPNPFVKGERLYKTGDLARWLPDGNLEFAGRMDEQVKIRGYRIELQEIETRLMQHPEVKEAVVLMKEKPSGEKYLIAYLQGNKNMDSHAYRAYLNASLPEYMVPNYFIQMENMPHSPNGKIDRKALPENPDLLDANKEIVQPRNETEEKILGMYKAVLEREDIGVHDNFFESGGNSLKVIRLFDLVNEVFPGSVDVNHLFDRTSVSSLVEFILKKNESASLFYKEAEEIKVREIEL